MSARQTDSHYIKVKVILKCELVFMFWVSLASISCYCNSKYPGMATESDQLDFGPLTGRCHQPSAMEQSAVILTDFMTSDTP